MGTLKQELDISQYIIYNSEEVIAFNKPPGIPIHLDRTNDISLHQMAEMYCKHPLNIVHRIDRPTSGIVLFSKSKHSTVELSKQFKNRLLRKWYLAIVPTIKRLQQTERIESRLFHDKKKNKSFVREWNEQGGKVAILDYEKLATSDHYTLLNVNIITGRHHQIRAQLSSIGCPIKGDVKYGSKRGNKDRSIHLHAWKIEFYDPCREDMITICCDPPSEDNLWRYFMPSLYAID